MECYITVSKDIFIENPPQALREWVKNYLIVDNPDFYKKERLGKWTGGTPSEIYLYETWGDELVLPFGCLRKVFELTQGCDVRFKALFVPQRRITYGGCINLYPYQQKAAEATLKAKNGILVMPCGSGKTQTALEIVKRIGGRCLWLTHTKDLLNQSMSRAKSIYTLPAHMYGTITEGKVNIGSGITFATIQTMSHLNLEKYRNEFDVIIIDECQHCCGSPTKVTQFYRVLSNLSARYKIGLTATPKRADGLERAMFALLGGITYKVDQSDVETTTCPIDVITYETGYTPEYNAVLRGDGTLDYSALIDDLVDNEERFDFVRGVIAGAARPVMVLANRVRYAQALADAYEGKAICLSTLGNSKAAKERRKQALADLNVGQLDAIFATYQLAKEGLDVPNLRTVIFATPEKDETTVIQSVGRVGRKAEGKQFGVVIDFIDNFGMYRSWAKKRQNYYKKCTL